ncbi:MAG: adenylyl-sulfate kinase, partial [Devosiaceae bacterium]|nr:adenylyl-sulfate kinase [Devosiaceae bacterium]
MANSLRTDWLRFSIPLACLAISGIVIIQVSTNTPTPIISAAKAATDAGLITICAFASYHQTDRDQVRARIGGPRFVHVYVNTPEALCRERRPDADFEGFEPPRTPDVTVDLESIRLDDAIDAILESLEYHGQFDEL